MILGVSARNKLNLIHILPTTPLTTCLLGNLNVNLFSRNSFVMEHYEDFSKNMCYTVSNPLVIKDFSFTIKNPSTNPYRVFLDFPIPEYIYLDINNGTTEIYLPQLTDEMHKSNSFGGIILLDAPSFRFKIRLTYSSSYYWYLFVTQPSPSIARTFNKIYEYRGPGSTGIENNLKMDGIFYVEIHYFEGNWYYDKLNS